MSKDVFCGGCGNKLKPGVKFCTNCGWKTEEKGRGGKTPVIAAVAVVAVLLAGVLIYMLASGNRAGEAGGISNETGGSTSEESAEASAPLYTMMEQIGEIPGDYYTSMLGLSRDGKRVAVLRDKEICVLDAESFEVLSSVNGDYDEELGFMVQSRKKALWSRDGDSFLFGNASALPNELVNFQRFNIVINDVKRNKLIKVTDEKLRAGTLLDTTLVHSSSWSTDGRSVIYNTLNRDGSMIYKFDIESGDRTLLMKDERNAIQGIELKEGLLLCVYYARKASENEVFLYDVENDTKKTVRGLTSRDGIPCNFEIKSLSNGGRKVLVNTWIPLPQGLTYISRMSILSFSDDFEDYEVDTIKYFDPKNMTSGEENINAAINSVMTTDGSYVIATEQEFNITEAENITSRKLVLHNLANGEKTDLYTTSDGEMFGFAAGPQNNLSEGLFAIDGGRIMVWFNDGYRIYQLK